ncbi:serine/threonine-protein phosphatase [Nocardia blacklockiae]|nr:serine/threonine-protein phosphatase [Nocardia blacklockiae]
MSFVVRAAARSDRGLVRSGNEDAVYAGTRLLALADGMGGHAGGEVASALMIAALTPLDAQAHADPVASLNAAVHAGNAAIGERAAATADLEGMGTTVTAILFGDNGFGLAHLGDSRGYRLRGGELSRLTRDDTFVQSLVDAGHLTSAEAASHPRRSVILQAATGAEIEPTLTFHEALVGDRYLLCSDGLTDLVDDATLAETLREYEQVADCADRLVALALAAGGSDNVTVVVADVENAPAAP